MKRGEPLLQLDVGPIRPADESNRPGTRPKPFRRTGFGLNHLGVEAQRQVRIGVHPEEQAIAASLKSIAGPQAPPARHDADNHPLRALEPAGGVHFVQRAGEVRRQCVERHGAPIPAGAGP